MQVVLLEANTLFVCTLLCNMYVEGSKRNLRYWVSAAPSKPFCQFTYCAQVSFDQDVVLIAAQSWTQKLALSPSDTPS